MNQRIASRRAQVCSQYARNVTHIIKMYDVGVYKRLNVNIYPQDTGVSKHFVSYNDIAIMMLSALQLSSSDK